MKKLLFLLFFALASACSAQTTAKPAVPYIQLNQKAYAFHSLEEGTRDSIFASDNTNIIVHYTDTLKIITIQDSYIESVIVNGSSKDRVITDETVITRRRYLNGR